MMAAASAPTMVVAATAAPHMMPVTVTVAPYEDNAVIVGEHIRFCDWHRQRR